jgi:glycosyltransferase involved in cell wall biosynthesis
MTVKHKQYLWLDINWEDSWFSSNYLVKNLRRCYQQKLGKDFHSFTLPADEAQLSTFIKANQITSVILADPRLNLLGLFKQLEGLEFLIHVIGAPLKKLEDLKQMKLEGQKICLLAGSRVNYQILKNSCSAEVKYFPFLPSACESSVNKQEVRNKFIYFGRLSHKKNVIALMELFAKYQKNINPSAELTIFGAACNANFPTKPPGHYIGMSADQFFHKLAQLQSLGHKIDYQGALSHDELQKRLGEFNTFVSLSTAEEEDFGMSVYESLTHNLSCVLSRWGGYREFENFDQVSLVDVIHRDKTLFVDQDQFFSALQKQNQTQVAALSSWEAERHAIIEKLDLNFEARKLNIKLERSFFSEEFFNEYTELVSPYWG